MSTFEVTIEALPSGGGWEARWSRDREPLGASVRIEGVDAAAVRDLSRRFLELFERRGQRPYADPAGLAALGKRLYDLWFRPAWGEPTSAPRGSGHRLVIRSREREVLNLPWELVELHREPLGCDAGWALLRTPLSELEPAGELTPGPLRILFLAADAVDQHRLDFEREEDAMLRALGSLGARVALHFAETGSFEELSELVAAIQPHVVHLSSHGVVNAEGVGTFVFEDEAGKTDVRTADEIVAEVFRGSAVRCVFFNGCQTSQAAVAGLCQELVEAGGPLALGWAASVADDRATDFAEAFYKRVAAGESLFTAAAHARLAIRKKGRVRQGKQEVQDATFALAQIYASEPEDALFDRTAPLTPYSGPKTEYFDLGDGIKGLREGFIGRRRQIQQVLPALRSGRTTVAILTGIGGMGKSTLATRIANRLHAEGYRLLPVRTTEGRTPAECARATLDKALAALSDAFEQEGRSDLRERMAKGELSTEQRVRLAVQGMAELRLVLVLDNFEDCLETETRRIAHPDLAAFYRALMDLLTRGSRVLVTCRYFPTDTPPDRATVQHLDLPDLEPHDCRKLVRRDPLVEKRLSTGELGEELLQSLFRQIGGTPGFLELARSLLRTVDLDALEQELAGETDGDLSEKRTAYLQRIFLERLYATLPPGAQDLVSRLALSELPLPLDAVAEIAGVPEAQVEQALRSCVEFGLAQRLSGADGTLFYHPPGLLRPWLAQPERISTEAAGTVHRLLAKFWQRASEADREVKLGISWLTVLETCRFHARLGSDLYRFQWATLLLASALHNAAEWQRSREVLEEITPDDRNAECLFALAVVGSSLGDWRTARGNLEQVLSILGDDQDQKASAWHLLATIDLYEGNYAVARENFAHSLNIKQVIGDHVGEAATWHQLALIDLNEGNHVAARENFARSLTVRQAIGDLVGEAATWHGLASIDLQQGNHAAAREKLGYVLTMCRSSRDRAGEAATWHSLASIDLQQGNYAAAHENFRSALTIRQSIGDRRGEAATWHQLGSIELAEGKYTAARKSFGRSLAIKQVIGDRRGEAATCDQLASIDLEQKHFVAALKNFIHVSTICQLIGHRYGEASAYHQLGTLALTADRDLYGAQLRAICWIIEQDVGHGDAPQAFQAFLSACAVAGLRDQQKIQDLINETAQEYQRDRGASLLKRAFPEGWEAGITPSG